MKRFVFPTALMTALVCSSPWLLRAARGASGEWRTEMGSPDAKVTVESYFPMDEDHAWARKLNKKIVDTFPNKVRVVQINWHTEEGLRVMEKKGLEPCGQYLVNGKVAVKRRPEMGGWTEAGLIGAVRKAVKTAYAGGAGKKSSDVTVYVPCGLTGPYGDIEKAFSKAHPEIKLHPVVNNTLPLRDKIAKGDKPELFLCVGLLELRPLEQKGQIEKGSLRKLAKTGLAIVAAVDNPKKLKKLEDLKKPSVKTIVIGDPAMLSNGAGATQAFKRSGLWDSIKGKVKPIKKAYTLKVLVAQGKADAAVVYRSCVEEVYAPGQKRKKEQLSYVTTISQKLFDEIPIVAVQIKGSKNPAGARTFVSYLTRPDSLKTFIKWGCDKR